MLNQHPITPPPELVAQWFLSAKAMPVDQWVTDVATKAAQWGADQELEACCEWLDSKGSPNASRLRTARRPKPPSLKAQALTLIDECTDPHGDYLDDNALAIIRRALESLPD